MGGRCTQNFPASLWGRQAEQPQVALRLWEGRGLQGDHARVCLSPQKGNDHTSPHQILIDC